MPAMSWSRCEATVASTSSRIKCGPCSLVTIPEGYAILCLR